MKLPVVALALLAVLSSCAAVQERAEATSPPPGAPLAIIGVTVLTMANAAPLADRTVIVREGRIAAIGPRRQMRVPRGAQTIDGRGRYLMPGLADMHVHLEYIEDPDVLKLFVASGVTTVRSMDGRPFILEWRERVRAGELVGPRIITAGPIIDGSPPAREDNLAVADAASARAAVAAQAAAGYDFIKLYSNLSPEAYAAALGEARERRLRVAGHVARAVPLEAAVASQWSIEHLGDFASAVAAQGGSPTPAWARRALAAPLDSQRLDALARRLAATQVWVVPTAIQQDRWLAPPATVQSWLAEPSIRHLPSSVLAQWRAPMERLSARMDDDDWALLERARRNRLAVIAALHRAGVRLAIGSDTPNPFVAMGASVHLELANFVAAGLSPADALEAATVDAARMLGLEVEQGTVEVGKRADLLLLARNPLDDSANASAIVGVVLGGRWFDEQALRAMSQDLGRP